MKRYFLLIGLLVLSLALVACGQNNDGGNANQNNDDVTNSTNDKNDNNTTGQPDSGTTNNDTAADTTSLDDMKKKWMNSNILNLD